MQINDGLAVQQALLSVASAVVSNSFPVTEFLDGLQLYQQASGQAHTYYVSTTGLDTNSGDKATPFKTIQHAVDAAQAGDTVLIEGGTYYERIINLRTSGTAEKPITISNAPGAQVVIDHGLQVTGWSNVKGSIYQTTSIVQNSVNDNPQNTQLVVVGDRALARVNDQQDLTEGTFWVDPNTGRIYVWAFGGGNPANESAVLINFTKDYQPGIRLFDTANHIVLNGFVDRGAETAIWAANFQTSPGQDLTISNCEIKDAWLNAVRLDNWVGATISNCNIYNTSLLQVPRNNGVDWTHAVVGYNADQIVIESNRIHDNNGEGVGPFLGCSDWTIQHNEIYDNWSVNVYIDTDEGDIRVDGNLIYNTGKYNQFERDRPDGIRISNEIADRLNADPTPGVYNVTITNNIIIGTGSGIRYFTYQNGPSYLTNSLIANNTIHAVDAGTDAITVNNGNRFQVSNNLTDAGRIVVPSASESSGIIVSHNLIPVPGSIVTLDNSFLSSNTNIVGVPNYTLGSGFSAVNYQLQSNSPAKTAGISLSGVNTDYFGKLRPQTGPYTIGAFEFASPASN